MWRRILLVLLVSSSWNAPETGAIKDQIYNLSGFPGFRDVILKWEYRSSAPREQEFVVRVCLIRRRSRNCAVKVLGLADRSLSILRDAYLSTYSAKMKDLRMATDYAFLVLPYRKTSEKTAAYASDLNEVAITTKKFSTRIIKCEKDKTVVEVETGPHFRGKISVENVSSPACEIRGKGSGLISKYVLSIDHAQCRASLLNHTSVVTYIAVQENASIVTYSTKRFMLVCKHSPATLVVQTDMKTNLSVKDPHFEGGGRHKNLTTTRGRTRHGLRKSS